MNKVLGRELERCLNQIDVGHSLEASLADAGPVADELRPLLRSALAVRALSVEISSDGAFHRGRQRMHSTLARRADMQADGRLRLRSQTLVALGALMVIAVLIVGVSTGFLHFGTATTEASVTGILSSVNEQSLVVQTADGPVTMRLNEATHLPNAGAQTRTAQQIRPGSSVKIIFEGAGNALTALQIELIELGERGAEGAPDVDVDFSGTVTRVDPPNISVQTSFGVAVVTITSDSDVSGSLTPAAAVEIHGSAEQDGSYTAEKITVLPSSSPPSTPALH